MSELVLDLNGDPILPTKAGQTRFSDINDDSFGIDSVVIGQFIRIDGRLGLDVTAYSDCTHRHPGKKFHRVVLLEMTGPLSTTSKADRAGSRAEG